MTTGQKRQKESTRGGKYTSVAHEEGERNTGSLLFSLSRQSATRGNEKQDALVIRGTRRGRENVSEQSQPNQLYRRNSLLVDARDSEQEGGCQGGRNGASSARLDESRSTLREVWNASSGDRYPESGTS